MRLGKWSQVLEARELREIVLLCHSRGISGNLLSVGKPMQRKPNRSPFVFSSPGTKGQQNYKCFSAIVLCLQYRYKGMRAKLPCNIRVLANITHICWCLFLQKFALVCNIPDSASTCGLAKFLQQKWTFCRIPNSSLLLGLPKSSYV